MPLLKLTVNGRPWSGQVPDGATLLDVLRDRLGLTGAKLGCGEGLCGSCTVLVAGRPLPACLTPAASAAAAPIITIEGLAPQGSLHPVQQAFIDVQAFQCGFCTPGMILAAVALLARTPAPRDEEITLALDKHLCRCGSYPQILAAVRAA
ncbi:MAG: (2Fe-2S)-binding protein, partial [Acidobacteriota bacterium]